MRLSAGTVANHAFVAAAGSNGFATSIASVEGVGVEVCGRAAVEIPKRREPASKQKITRFVTHHRYGNRLEKKSIPCG